MAYKFYCRPLLSKELKMITSINGLSNTSIQDNTIQKENATENVAKEGKQDKNATEEKFDYSKNLFETLERNYKRIYR